MFGTNQITGKKFFKDAPENTLFVTSMFFTLQGEGPYAGLPALFIRLAKCNLTCSFCDTFFDDGEWMTYQQINARAYHTMCEYWNNRGELVPEWVLPKGSISGMSYPNVVLVITGGEPMLQANLGKYLSTQGLRWKAMQIETNGTIDQTLPTSVTVVCSPKCSEKNGVATKYLEPSKFILERADCLKFVISSDKTSPYSEVPEWAHEWKRNNPSKEIYCSPMNVYNTFPQKIKLLRAGKEVITMEERSTVDEVISFWEKDLLDLAANQANHEYTGKYCLDYGFKLNLQQHLYVSMA
jgi:7-carboxy-7-deazaguanine synthase